MFFENTLSKMLIAVEKRQRDIQQHKLRVKGREFFHDGVEILHAPRVQLPLPQMRADGLRDAGVVLDQQNTVHASAS